MGHIKKMESSIFNTGKIKKNYKFGKVLGEGSFATVRLAVRKSTHEQVAVKIIDKTALESDD